MQSRTLPHACHSERSEVPSEATGLQSSAMTAEGRAVGSFVSLRMTGKGASVQTVTVLNDSAVQSGCLASVASSLKASISALVKSRPPAAAVCFAQPASS